MKLNCKFYERPTAEVAKDLLGKYIVFNSPAGKVEAKIVEVEAYLGPQDLAAHTAGGRRTQRNEVMWGQAGHAYVYFTYGMHYMLNVVTVGENIPQAVLIRALEAKGCNGPARLTKTFGIDKKLNGTDLTGNTLWIEDRGEVINNEDIIEAKRIGVDYAGTWKDKPLRFYIKGNTYVSRMKLKTQN